MRSRHVAVNGSVVRIYCSEECLRGVGEQTVEIEIEEPRRRKGWMIAAGLALGGAGLGVYYWLDREEPANDAPAAPVITHAAPSVAIPAPTPPAISDQQREDEALLVELMHDTWIHPLAGPRRRMPINHTAAFGANREGIRPPECVSGHCGVDVGDTWGEPVHAVHDGVVDWVNRGPNEEHGGIFVKIAHRNGTLYSWYFHLAGVPRWVKPGVKISAGQVIGALGDTGIGRSVPHLHFSLSVKTGKNTERYIDPEPLIAIWPLWIPDEGKGHLSTAEPPGTPVRAADRPKPPPEVAKSPETTGSDTPAPAAGPKRDDVTHEATASGAAPQ